jgi:hypothetical protein
VLRLSSALRNPFSFLFARSSTEERVAEYIVREHANGRALDQILQDRYVQNRLTARQQLRLLDRPELVHAIGQHDLDSARSELANAG